ncbi:MAG TPA: zinc-finger domain-containing protein [Caldimonas sp.]
MADQGVSAMATGDPRKSAVVELAASELQGPGVVFCPNPKMPLWSNHPRVFIDVATTGSGKCPYCGTEYRLKAGEKVHSSH